MRPLGVHVSDSYAWVNTVEKSAYAYFFHPHHVLYLPLAWRWTRALQAIAPRTSTWAAMAAMSAAFGCAGVAAVYGIVRLVGGGTVAAVAGAFATAVSFGYWFFASDAEVYVVSGALALWAFYFLARLVSGGKARNAAWAGVAAGFAALFHQTGIFVFVPAGVVFAGLGRRASVTKNCVMFACAFAGVVAPVYIAAGWAALPEFTFPWFVRWLFLFAGKGYGGFSAASTLHAPVGFARALVGGQMALDALRGATVANGLVWFGAALAAAAFGGTLLYLAFAAARFGAASREARLVTGSFAAAFAVYALFSVYFDAVNFEWWTIPVTLVLAGAASAGLSGARPVVVPALCAGVLVASANFVMDFEYRRGSDCDFVRNAARDVVALTESGDVIIAPSYLGVLIWNVEGERKVFCPDEAVRLYGRGKMKSALAGMVKEENARGARFVIAGADRAEETRDFALEILEAVPQSEREEIGTIRFLDGGRRIVKTVSEVPVTAVRAQEVVEAFSTGRIVAARDAGR